MYLHFSTTIMAIIDNVCVHELMDTNGIQYVCIYDGYKAINSHVDKIIYSG